MTRAEARAGLLRHLAETLRALPAGSELALRHPDLPNAVLHNGVTVLAQSADNSDGVLDPEAALERFEIRYWVVGATPRNSGRCLELLLDAWRDKGPVEIHEGRPRTARTQTADGFALTATRSLNGYLSLAGSTPSFEPGSGEGDPFPRTLR